MPEFIYTILSPSGKESTSKMTAVSEAEVIAFLKAEGHFLLKLEQVQEGVKRKGEISLDGLRASLDPAKPKHLPLLFRQVAVLLESGVSIVSSLALMENQSGPYGLRKMMQSIRKSVESGETLSESLGAYPQVFSPYIVNMVGAAELSGDIENVMVRIADQLEITAAFKRQLITSLIYPGFVLVAAVGVIAFLTLSVIPKFAAMLGKDKGLPPVTQLIMDVSGWMQSNWQLFFGIIFGVITLAVLLRKTPEGKLFIDKLLLHIPVVKGVVRCDVVVTFTRNLAMLFASGVPLVEALGTVKKTISNAAAALVVEDMVNNILEGESMSTVLAQHEKIFPSMVCEMVRTGEETGEMVKVLELTANIYQSMLETNVKRMNAMMEPLIIAVLGGLVALVMYGLIAGMLAVYGL